MTQTSEAAEQLPVSHHTVNEKKNLSCPDAMVHYVTQILFLCLINVQYNINT